MASSEADNHRHHERVESRKSATVVGFRRTSVESNNVRQPADSIEPLSEKLRNDAHILSTTTSNVVKYTQDIEKRITELEYENRRLRLDSAQTQNLKQKLTDAENEKAALKEDIARIQRDERKKCHELKKKLESRDKKVEQLIKENEEHKTRFTNLQVDECKTTHEGDDELRSKLDSRDRQVKKLSEECEDLKTRLSKVISNKLADGSLIIQELSDCNRPTKLAERYMELYDNQWTDALDTVQEYKKRRGTYLTDVELEKEAISILLQVLKEVWQFCKDELHEQDIQVKEAILRRKNSPQSLPDDFLKQLKSTKKILDVHIADAVLKNVIGRKQKVKDFRTNYIEPYVKECVALCWSMANQDPPVVFELKTMPGDEFDEKKYRVYMKRGSHIDFVIWPPMLLHEQGLVLAKGIAQGTRHNIHRQADATIKSQTRGQASYAQSTMTAEYQRPRNQRNVETNEDVEYRNLYRFETGTPLYRQESASKSHQSDEKRCFKQEIVTPVVRTPSERSRVKQNLMYQVYGGYTSTLPTKAEYDRYLEYSPDYV